MLTASINREKINKALVLPFVVAAAYLILGLVYLKDYFTFDLYSCLGLCVAPFIFIVRDKEKKPLTYFFLSMAVLAFSFVLQLRTLYFFSFTFALLFLLESTFGKLNPLSSILLLSLCPVFTYVNVVAGLPLRWFLTDFAAGLLSLAGYEASAVGNTILFNGEEFSVDPACAGLKMMATALLVGMLFMAHFERKTNIRLGLIQSLFVLGAILLLNIVSNLFRIILLVIGKIPAETIFHDITGICCLVLYVIIPSFFLTRWIGSRRAVSNETRSVQGRSVMLLYILNILLLSIIAFKSTKLEAEAVKQAEIPANITIPGYDLSKAETGVLKFEKENALVYVKPIYGFYSAEHTPLVCWTGSGYSFTNVKKEKVNDQEIYYGILVKGTDKIYASWWFDNGTHKTIDQWDWRWKVMLGEEGFCLINVNSDSETNLRIETEKILSQNIIHNK